MVLFCKKYLKTVLFVCVAFALTLCCVLPILHIQNSAIATGASNATLTISSDESNNMPFDATYTLNVCDENKNVVYSQSFNGSFFDTCSTTLEAGKHYSFMIFAPTSVVVWLGLGDIGSLSSNFFGTDFVMPSTGLALRLVVTTRNPSIFSDSSTV